MIIRYRKVRIQLRPTRRVTTCMRLASPSDMRSRFHMSHIRHEDMTHNLLYPPTSLAFSMLLPGIVGSEVLAAGLEEDFKSIRHSGFFSTQGKQQSTEVGQSFI